MVAARAAFALSLALAAGAAAAQPTLAELDRVGRAIAAQPCPRPVEAKSSFIANPRRRDVADEMRSVDCRAWRVAVYVSHSTVPPREQPMELVVIGAEPRLDPRLAVGATPAAVRALLGEPQRLRGASLVYTLGGRDTLSFEVSDDMVRAVAWSWDVD